MDIVILDKSYLTKSVLSEKGLLRYLYYPSEQHGITKEEKTSCCPYLK